MPSRIPTAALAVWLALLAPLGATAQDITVFAASSLKTALDQVAADWQAETGKVAALAYDGSAKLARQIAQGAPADLFIAAAPDWMDLLQAQGLIVPASRRDILGNTLVLVSHDAASPVSIGPDFPLAARLNGEKLAMGMVTSVPAGQYGKAALVALGLWNGVASQVVETESARAALALVALGEAPYGIVFASDAVSDPQVSVAGRFAASTHPPIRYPAALTKTGNTAAQAFLDYLSGPQALARFAAQGFVVLQ